MSSRLRVELSLIGRSKVNSISKWSVSILYDASFCVVSPQALMTGSREVVLRHHAGPETSSACQSACLNVDFDRCFVAAGYDISALERLTRTTTSPQLLVLAWWITQVSAANIDGCTIRWDRKRAVGTGHGKCNCLPLSKIRWRTNKRQTTRDH